MGKYEGGANAKVGKCEGGIEQMRRWGRGGGGDIAICGSLTADFTLKIGADCCQLCQYKLTKPNLT